VRDNTEANSRLSFSPDLLLIPRGILIGVKPFALSAFFAVTPTPDLNELAALARFAHAFTMATWIALLRGIGGGIRSLEMKKLVRALEGIGLENVRTYIATGNVVFTSRKKAAQLAKDIEACIEEKFGFVSKTFVLSPAELVAAAAQNPFPQANENHKSLHLFFLAAPPKRPKLDDMNELKASSEQFVLKGKVFYFYAPDGFGTSKLGARIGRFLDVEMTARNWRTVQKLIEMSAQ
jgi:uncharacterized protein (DUF1697 family)